MSLLAAPDAALLGREIAYAGILLGHVQGVARDPHSGRVRRLITTYRAGYGGGIRRVAIPPEWVVGSDATRLVLGVGVGSLDELPDDRGEPIRYVAPAVRDAPSAGFAA